ncbi:MAG: SMP-30/gluconolactonase/LRE family protein [Candidatus Rokubacteria bacterium]|nr:SMP-30/gluconolactonase/LRE family protein [Candidatus Rokubacteria bacterium]
MRVTRRTFIAASGTTALTLALAPRAFARGGAVVRYPESGVKILDHRFEKYWVDSALIERIATGFRFTEGPVWFGDSRSLLFSDVPSNRIMRWSEETGRVETFRKPSRYTNGNARDRQGRLICAEHESHSITRTEFDGRVTTLIDTFEGKNLNAPNDVIVKSDGSIWFSDPVYGGLYEARNRKFEHPARVYRLDPATGQASVVAGDMAGPNGLSFSPDESKLYVVDSSGKPPALRVYDVAGGTRLANGRAFVDMSPGNSDGMRVDMDGNVWTAAKGGEGFDGVHVFAPNGDKLARILLPEPCANLCFGGVQRNRLFMTAGQSVYALYTEAQGSIRL